MAIIVEEERGNRIDIVRIAGWGVILIVLGAAIYYIFFAAPQLVTISPPPGYSSIAPISGLSIQPENVLNGAAYQALKQPNFPLPTPSGPAPVGRLNPFIAP